MADEKEKEEGPGGPEEGPTGDYEGGKSSEPSNAEHYLSSGQTLRPEDDTTTKPKE